jgi:hypothetical protein
MKTYLIRLTKEELKVLRLIINIGCDTGMACREVSHNTGKKIDDCEGCIAYPIKNMIKDWLLKSTIEDWLRAIKKEDKE